MDRFIVRRAEAPEDWVRDATGHPIDPETGAALPDPDTTRLADSVETALRLGEGVVVVAPVPRDGEPPAFEERLFSERYSLPLRRDDDRRAGAPLVLVQLAPRRLPHVHGSRHASW